MALVTRASDASPDTSNALVTAQVAGLIAGEDIDVGAPCYIKGDDGKVYMSYVDEEDIETEAANIHGWSFQSCKAGAAVTLAQPGVRYRYAASGLTPGQPLYLGSEPGTLADSDSAAEGAHPIAFAINTTDIIAIALSLPSIPVAEEGGEQQ